MLTQEITTTAPVVTDTEATPLSTSEGNAILGMSAANEKKPTVPGADTERHWRTAGQVD